jgi:hypothetical protein
MENWTKIYFPRSLDSFLLWGYIPRDGSGKEGTVSTASRNCRNRLQRLQERGKIAPRSVGSRRKDPWALRPMRLQWQNNLSGKHQTPCDLGLCQSDPKAKTAASLKVRQRFSGKSDNPGSCPGQAFPGVGGCRALSQTILNTTLSSICRLEARAGTSPPPSSLNLRCMLRSIVPRRAKQPWAPPAK